MTPVSVAFFIHYSFIQDSLSRAEHHIWFERSEAGDRKKVVQRLREHVEDENKLPIIIFPEGTCINNTSVMMFKKGSFEEGEDAIAFARRVKRAIAKKGGLVDLEWDGALKRERVSSKLIQLQQKLYYDRLTRTTTINNITEEDLQTDVLDIMQSISEEDRNSLMRQLDETDDDDAIIRKVSAYRHDLRKLSDTMGAAVEPDSKHV
ncbi:hypothetical protein TELCIR_00329 [Teladorsagia circumcincta]|uniref:Phospholipid/glycerol acyltransferase domain-containing protein n=1 Tax=Teladorsagia circumcincta TaxID=45464 RepID=A0A2G9V4Z2_TELCI|nr:hypothetical protein TELCIR_00329 [Teladorsagia circumcincta]